MESAHDIYAAGSTARPLQPGDWVLQRCKLEGESLYLLSEMGYAVGVDGCRWSEGVEVGNSWQFSKDEATRILTTPFNEQWHRLTPAEAVAWMAEHLAGEETR